MKDLNTLNEFKINLLKSLELKESSLTEKLISDDKIKKVQRVSAGLLILLFSLFIRRGIQNAKSSLFLQTMFLWLGTISFLLSFIHFSKLEAKKRKIGIFNNISLLLTDLENQIKKLSNSEISTIDSKDL